MLNNGELAADWRGQGAEAEDFVAVSLKRDHGEKGMPKKEKLEHSELAGEFTDDGVTVLVDIFRKAGTNGDWTMEIVTQDEDLIQWDEPFATDREAFDEFLATVAKDGIRSFLEEDEQVVH